MRHEKDQVSIPVFCRCNEGLSLVSAQSVQDENRWTLAVLENYPGLFHMREKYLIRPSFKKLTCHVTVRLRADIDFFMEMFNTELHELCERERCSENISRIIQNNLVAPKGKAHQIQ
jgi:hypothetical protein